MTLNSSYCPQCGTPSEGYANFCTNCGAKRPGPYETSLPPIVVTETPRSHSANSEPSRTHFSESSLSAISVDVAGNLPLCPKCNKTKLIWEKRPVPGWVMPCLVIGVILTLTCIGAILGIPLWAIGMGGMLQGRKVEPYCPACKWFFQRQS